MAHETAGERAWDSQSPVVETAYELFASPQLVDAAWREFRAG